MRAGSDPASGEGFLGELVSCFRQAGRALAAESWVSTQPNMPVDVRELEAALGPDTLDELAHRTGLPRAELLLRPYTALPEVVNRFIPEGRLPTEAEADRFV